MDGSQLEEIFWRPLIVVLLAVAAALVPTRLAYALEIEQVIWGFDGKALAQRFNPLSVLVSNPSDEPFEGKLHLQKSRGGGQRFGARIEQPAIYISPFASRWVQFYPFVKDRFEQWTLSWGLGPGNSATLDSPRIGEPACVLLSDPTAVVDRGGAGLRRFPENLFPSMVTATDALQTVVLDHSPRWEAARRTAFRDWLLRGGTVHLLQNDNQRFPEFHPDLAELNAPVDILRVGSGFVHRHERSRGGLDRKFVNEVILEQRESEAAQAGGSEDYKSDARGQPAYADNWNDLLLYDLAVGLFSELKRMTRPNHSWPLIYAMAFLYILLIFPGCYVLGFRRLDYKLVYGSLLGVVVLFSLGFSVVGRRGYGEATAVHSVAIARPLSSGSYDVSAWSNAFVTDGDYYTIAHEGSGALYSTCQSVEAVNGVIANSPGGRFIVDIPPFSSRSFGHRIKAPGPQMQLEVLQWQADDVLERFEIAIEGQAPEYDAHTMAYALHRDRLYKIEVDGKRLRLAASSRRGLGAYLGTIDSNRYGQYGAYMWQNQNNLPAERRFREMFKPLLATSLNVSTRSGALAFSLPADRVRVLIYARMPESFLIEDLGFGKQQGYVLYAIDVFAPEQK